MLKAMPQQVVSIQNDETAVNVKHNYKDVFTLEIGEHAKLRMKRDSLLEILTTLRLFTDIVDSDKGTRIYIHDDARAGEANYDMSTRLEFIELVKKYEHTASVKKYAGITRKFITLFSRSVPGIKENEKQVMSLVAAKKETNEGESSDWLLSIDIRSYFVMEDGVVRPTQIGISIHQDLAISVMRSASEIEKMIKIYSEKQQLPSTEEKSSRKRRKPYEKKAVTKAAKTDNEYIGDLFFEWANLMEKFRTKMQKN